MIKVGITERGDAGLDFSWVDKLQPVNIIITKHLTRDNHKLVGALLDNKDKIILHCTCTGYGGTRIEPNVPSTREIFLGVRNLIEAGFPLSHIVLRTDPIIPTERGIKTVEKIWNGFSWLNIKRCRYSVIDMYPHVKARFMEKFGRVPFDTFQAPPEMMQAVKNAVLRHKDQFEFESCVEDLPEPVGCISKKDFEILGVPFDNLDGGYQRKGCLCCSGKTELLTEKRKCPSGCVYCYWKD